MRKIMASIDIGSSLIKLVVGEISKNGSLHVLASSMVPSAGVKHSLVIEPQKLVKSLESAFQKCEEALGIKINKVLLSVPSDECEFFMSDGSTTIVNDDHMIHNQDVVHALQGCTYNKIEDGQEIVSIKATSYKVDGEKIRRNPVGIEADTLEVRALVVIVPRKNILPFIKCLEKIGVEVIDFSLGVIGDYYEFQQGMMKDSVGSFIKIGYHSTELSIFNKGLLTNTKKLKYGASSLISDIIYTYHLTKKDAKEVLNKLSSVNPHNINASVKYNFTDTDGKSVTFTEYDVVEIVYSRIIELLKIVKKEINHLTKKEIHYIMVSGGVCEMPSFSSLLEEVFGHEAKIGEVKELGVRSNIFSSCVGLIKLYDEKMALKNQEYGIFDDDELEELINLSNGSGMDDHSILSSLFNYFFEK